MHDLYLRNRLVRLYLLMHSKTASSATSETFTESVLHTPQTSEFPMPPFVVKSDVEPSVGIDAIVDKERVNSERAVDVVVIES